MDDAGTFAPERHGLGGGQVAEAVPAALPHNLEAEHALLGILLYDNGPYERCGALRPDQWFEPFHGFLYSAIETAIRKGQVAEPITLHKLCESGPMAAAYEELGGVRYLADLVDRAPPASNARDYASQIIDEHKRREVIRVGGAMITAAKSRDLDISADDIVETAEAELYGVAEHAQGQGGFITFSTALTGAIGQAAEAYGREGGLSGIATGLIDLDRKTGGLHGSDLIVLAGRPSMGKTALATNIAFNVAKNYAFEMQPDGTKKTVQGGIVAFYSLEMSAEQLGLRILADAAGVPSDRIRRGEIDAREFGLIRDAAQEIQDAPLYVDATGGLTLAQLTARARRLKRQHGLDLIIVDYLQLVTVPGYGGGQRVQEVSAITVGLKALAKELACPIIALSQLSRQVEQREDKRPQLSDLRESGSIEQDADMVWFVYREAYYVGRAEPRPGTPEHTAWQDEMDAVADLAELIIGKQRHGPIGTVRLDFTADTTRFHNAAPSSAAPNSFNRGD
jgi:replicative DNA helicase